MDLNYTCSAVLVLPARIYYVKSHTTRTGEVLFYAEFQPVNPKTGKPWQATRRVPATGLPGECHYLAKNTTGEGVVRDGPFPWKDWLEGGRWTSGVGDRFRTFDQARTACRDHATKKGLLK